MDEVLELANELRKAIDETPEFQEYQRVKVLYENNKELETMRREIARLANEHKEEERKNLLAVYNSHPLVVNYEASKKEVTEILLTVKNIIQ